MSGGSTLVNIVALLIRGDWDIGVQSSYFFRNPAADSNIARLLAGLPQYKKEFSIMNPLFKANTSENRIAEGIKIVFPGSDTSAVHTKAVLRICLARMLYSTKWIRDNVPALQDHKVPEAVGHAQSFILLQQSIVFPRSSPMTSTTSVTLSIVGSKKMPKLRKWTVLRKALILTPGPAWKRKTRLKNQQRDLKNYTTSSTPWLSRLWKKMGSNLEPSWGLSKQWRM